MTTFRIATESDDDVLRAILRDNAMPTWVDMAVEREPSFFAAKNVFGRDWAVIAEDGGNVIGMYTAAVVPVHVNGRPEQLGYLGGLRVNPGHRRHIRYLREGYASIRAMAPITGSLPWWFTVVASDNTAARRLLEAGVRGVPAYHLQGEYLTFAIPAARGKRRGLWRRAVDGDVRGIVEFHNAQAARFQCSPVLSEELVRRIGVERFLVFENGARTRMIHDSHASQTVIPSVSEGSGGRAGIMSFVPPNRRDPSLTLGMTERDECSSGRESTGLDGVAALWDQRAFKQIVARRYRAPLGSLVRIYNLYARISRRIPLPRAGRALEQTFIAFLALSDAALSEARALSEDLLSHCTTPAASLGLHAAHPLVQTVERFKPLRYPTRVYAVSFDGTVPPNGRPAQPEAALL